MGKQRAALPVPADHPAYAGHFPGMPVLPGVVLLDEALHAIGACGTDRAWTVTSFKFLSPVTPGESLEIEYEIADGAVVRLDILANGRRVATGSLRAREA